MVISGLRKQPSEVFRQKVDYTYWLNGATITDVDVVIAPAGGTVPLAVTVTNLAGIVSLYISGGDDATDYTITVLATISDGQVREDEVKIRVQEIS